MSIDLNNLSPDQLDALIANAKKAKKAKQKEAKRTPAAEVKRLLAALAREHKYTLDELFGASKPARASKGSKVAAKYRNPATGDTWSGRGKQPKWLAGEIAKGRTLADFAI